MAIDGSSGSKPSSIDSFKFNELNSESKAGEEISESSGEEQNAKVSTISARSANPLAAAFVNSQSNIKIASYAEKKQPSFDERSPEDDLRVFAGGEGASSTGSTNIPPKKEPIPGEREPEDDLVKPPENISGNRPEAIEVLQDAVGANGLDTNSSGEVYNVAQLIALLLDIDINKSLVLVDNLIQTGNFKDGATGEDIFNKLNGSRYQYLGGDQKVVDFIANWQPYENKQDQINELNQQLADYSDFSIAGPTNQGEVIVWQKGDALAHSLSLMLGIDPFEAADLLLEYHNAGLITEDSSAEQIFELFDANNDSIIDHKDAILDAEATASRSDITPTQIQTLINGPYRNDPQVVQNLVNNSNVSDESILDLVYSPALGPVSEEILTIVANSDRINNSDIAGAIYNAENATPALKELAAQSLGIEEESGHHGLWHRAKDWFEHVENKWSDFIALGDDLYNQLGTSGEILGFIEGADEEAIKFLITAEILTAVVGAIAAAGVTVVAAGAGVVAGAVAIEDIIEHIKDPSAGHLTGPLASTLKSAVEGVAHSIEHLFTDLQSNVSTLVEGGYVLVVPNNKAEPARFVNPNTEDGKKQLDRTDVTLFAPEHTQTQLPNYSFSGTTAEFKHERPYEHGKALGHFVGEIVQTGLVLKDIAKIALNGGGSAINAITNSIRDSAADDLGHVNEVTAPSGETASPREYAKTLSANPDSTAAFNDYLKLNQSERIAVRSAGFTPEPPLELTSFNFHELNTLLENNNIKAEFTFNAEGELEIYLKDSADIPVDSGKRAAIEQKIQETLNNQQGESAVKNANFNWLGQNEAVPSEHYKAGIVGKGGNLEVIKGGAGSLVPYDETFQLEPGRVGRQQYYDPNSPWGNPSSIRPIGDQEITWDGEVVPDEFKVTKRAYRSDHRLFGGNEYNPKGETWDERNPGLKQNLRDIFNNGTTADRYKQTQFGTTANNNDVYDHTATNGGSRSSNFLSSTTDFDIAKGFNPENAQRAVIIDADVTGLDVEGAAGWARENGLPTTSFQHAQSEISVWDGVPPEKIRGVYLIESLDGGNIHDGGEVKVTYIRNPYYGK